MSAVIAPATKADIGSLLGLNAEIQALHTQWRPDLFRADTPEHELAAFWQGILASPANHLAMARVSGQVAGYLWADVKDRAPDAFFHARRTMTIHHLAVGQAFRKQGIGTSLLSWARKIASDLQASELILNMWADNADAAAFYAANGGIPRRLELELALTRPRSACARP